MLKDPEEQGISSAFAAHFLLASSHVAQMVLCCCTTFVSSLSCINVFPFKS